MNLNWLYRLLRKQERVSLQKYRYLYQTYPFDGIGTRFTVWATTAQEADELAHAKFKKVVESGRTVMREFHALKH